MRFSKKQIDQLNKEYGELENSYIKIQSEAFELLERLKIEKAKEYLLYGFIRRLSTLKRCIDNIYRLYPPSRKQFLQDDVLKDCTINLQAFVLNVYGCLDNLALVFKYEKEVNIHPKSASFFNKKLQQFLSKELTHYLVNELEQWTLYQHGFRHALAHRVPLYIPSRELNGKDLEKHRNFEVEKMKAIQGFNMERYEKYERKQGSLGENLPVMVHSFLESSEPVLFHSQILADFNTVKDFFVRVLKEFSRG